MIRCPKCKKEFPEGRKFCVYCGTPLTQANTQVPLVQRSAQRSVQENAVAINRVASNQMNTVEVSKKKKRKNDKSMIVAIIAVILSIALIAGGIFTFKFISDKKKEADLSENRTRFENILKESTTKPIVEMVVEDYDLDGTYEAYAIVGETDEEDEEHPEFYDADIYFVNQKKAQLIKENVSGKVNCLFELDGIIYISIEIYINGTTETYSLIFTVNGRNYVEHEESGKYSNVHKEGKKIIGYNKNNEEVEINSENKKNVDNNDTPKPEDSRVGYLPSKITSYDSDDCLVDVYAKYEYNFDSSEIKCYVGYDGEYYRNECVIDDNSNIIESSTYKPDGTFKLGSKCEYDSNGNMVKYTLIWSDGTVDSYGIYEYDSNGNLIEIIEYDDEYIPYGRIVYEYDSRGNNIGVTDYNSDNTINNIHEYSYDSDDNMIKDVHSFYEDDVLSYSYIETYEYDSNGNLIEETKYNTYDDESDCTIYEYDSNGREIKISSYENGNYNGCSTIEYNSNGKKTKCKHYDADNNYEGYDLIEYIEVDYETEEKYFSSAFMICDS